MGLTYTQEYAFQRDPRDLMQVATLGEMLFLVVNSLGITNQCSSAAYQL